MQFYAKTNPVETIREHTDNVLKEFYNLKTTYRKEIDLIIKDYIEAEEFWNLLKVCCEYHDYGKANMQFQNKLREKLGEVKLKSVDIEEIPHNYLSPAFIPIELLEKLDNSIGIELVDIMIQVIAYHHERNSEPEYKKIAQIIEDDLSINRKEIYKHMGSDTQNLNYGYASEIGKRSRVKDNNKSYKIYIMLKGLLHKIDHAASAHHIIEEKTNISVSKATEKYMESNNWSMRSPQIFARNNRNKNLVIIASTGMGKTETALFWIDNDKAFFTLPLRVSINALFNRVKDEIKYDHVGLVHSSALEYLEDNGYEDSYKLYEEAQLLSKKLSFSTIDQIFKYPFKYRGYEKALATLSYSKVVIDEIQAYSPHIAAVILYAIKQLHEMGGKFLIMTATFPRIYKDKLREFGIEFEEQKFISEMKRHRISLVGDELINACDEIRENGKDYKVLVIVNTVDKALDVYSKFNEIENVNLLHSMFTNSDRARLEKEIKVFTEKDNKETGIWITTQIVEASLDVDFDYLYTEMSTLDSQFQRFGRCYRKRNYEKAEPNIYIYTKNISGAGSIYDEDILKRSINELLPFNGCIVEEGIKVELVDRLYSKEALRETKFLKEFKNSCLYLENIVAYETSSKEAQKILRYIDSCKVMPMDIYNENIDLIEEFKSSLGEERRKLLMKVNKLTLNVPTYKIRKFKKSNDDIKVTEVDGFKDLFTINIDYSSKEGLISSKLSDNMF
ncbi:MAG: CRISPR-associated helicase Cas3' [Clostridium sp.]|uniref:CRISPR-associated helicase Cas3' n=1 Tax=Clostridium sp. TaxID=1506 RepID=UPI00303D14D4